MELSGRRTAVSIGGITVLALIGSGIAFRHDLAKAWHVFRLRSGSEQERIRAAEALVRVGAIDSAPYLIRAILEDERETYWAGQMGSNSDSIPPERLAEVSTWTEVWVELGPISFSLWRFGKGAAPFLEAALESFPNQPRDPQMERTITILEGILASWNVMDGKTDGKFFVGRWVD
jgi:hypothetical protein